jgi:hypothetical protein
MCEVFRNWYTLQMQFFQTPREPSAATDFARSLMTQRTPDRLAGHAAAEPFREQPPAPPRPLVTPPNPVGRGRDE